MLHDHKSSLKDVKQHFTNGLSANTPTAAFPSSSRCWSSCCCCCLPQLELSQRPQLPPVWRGSAEEFRHLRREEELVWRQSWAEAPRCEQVKTQRVSAHFQWKVSAFTLKPFKAQLQIQTRKSTNWVSDQKSFPQREEKKSFLTSWMENLRRKAELNSFSFSLTGKFSTWAVCVFIKTDWFLLHT